MSESARTRRPVRACKARRPDEARKARLWPAANLALHRRALADDRLRRPRRLPLGSMEVGARSSDRPDRGVADPDSARLHPRSDHRVPRLHADSVPLPVSAPAPTERPLARRRMAAGHGHHRGLERGGRDHPDARADRRPLLSRTDRGRAGGQQLDRPNCRVRRARGAAARPSLSAGLREGGWASSGPSTLRWPRLLRHWS